MEEEEGMGWGILFVIRGDVTVKTPLTSNVNNGVHPDQIFTLGLNGSKLRIEYKALIMFMIIGVKCQSRLKSNPAPDSNPGFCSVSP